MGTLCDSGHFFACWLVLLVKLIILPLAICALSLLSTISCMMEWDLESNKWYYLVTNVDKIVKRYESSHFET